MRNIGCSDSNSLGEYIRCCFENIQWNIIIKSQLVRVQSCFLPHLVSIPHKYPLHPCHLHHLSSSWGPRARSLCISSCGPLPPLRWESHHEYHFECRLVRMTTIFECFYSFKNGIGTFYMPLIGHSKNEVWIINTAFIFPFVSYRWVHFADNSLQHLNVLVIKAFLHLLQVEWSLFYLPFARNRMQCE